MKRYSVSLIFLFLILFSTLSLFVSQLNTAYAATNPGPLKTCKTNKDCASFTSTTDLVCDPISNTCQPPQKKGQSCTGTGINSTCANGLTCTIVQSTCKSVVVPGGKTAQSCQTTCQTPPPKQPSSGQGVGQSCTGYGQGTCANTLSCISKVCYAQSDVGGPCGELQTENGEQGIFYCKPNLICDYSDDHIHIGLCPRVGTEKCPGSCEVGSPSPSLPQPPSPPCQTWSSNGQCLQFATAFGPISTDPEGFVRTIFAILLSVSGGIAILLIIRAGYQLITSQGKPEQIQNGRDQLIAAVIGLVFLIFAFVFLQLIGFDILRVPGFGQ